MASTQPLQVSFKGLGREDLSAVRKSSCYLKPKIDADHWSDRFMLAVMDLCGHIDEHGDDPPVGIEANGS